MADQYASSVLNELKETIRNQASQIEFLQLQLATATGATNASSSSTTTTTTTSFSSSSIANTSGNNGVSAKSALAPAAVGHGHGHSAAPQSVEEMAGYLARPFYQITIKRVGWLGLFLTSLSGTALIMNGFEHTLQKQLELAYFVPMLAGHGGNTGGQAVGTVLSAISSGVLTLRDAPLVIFKEALSGCLSGLILGSAVSGIAHYGMGISIHVAVVLLCTLPLVSTIAATLGSTIPFVCLACGLDPSVIAAPAMTSFVDVLGLLSYFLIAGQVFHLFGLELD